MQETDNSKNRNQVVHGSNKKTRKFKKAYLLIAVVILVIIGVGVFYLTQKKEAEGSKTTNAEKSISYSFEESASAEAYGNLLSATLESFKIGGNANGIKVEARGHYPTEDQIKNRDWAAKNLKLNEGITRLIEQGKLTYLPEGCEQEKCISYTIKAGGVEVAKNLN